MSPRPEIYRDYEEVEKNMLFKGREGGASFFLSHGSESGHIKARVSRQLPNIHKYSTPPTPQSPTGTLFEYFVMHFQTIKKERNRPSY